MSWNFYPEDRFSSYDDYIKYLKEMGFAFDAPEGMYENFCYEIIFLFAERIW